MKMQPVFHVSLLQPWHENGKVQAVPPCFLVNGKNVFMVDKIVEDLVVARI